MTKTNQDKAQKRQRTMGPIAHGAVIRLRRDEAERLEAYRNRAVALLSVSGVIVAVALRTDTDNLHFDKADLAILGIVSVIVGIAGSLAGVVCLLRPMTDDFAESPKALMEIAECVTELPTSADIYRHLATTGEEDCKQLAQRVTARCNWLWANISGLLLIICGVALVWFSDF